LYANLKNNVLPECGAGVVGDRCFWKFGVSKNGQSWLRSRRIAAQDCILCSGDDGRDELWVEDKPPSSKVSVTPKTPPKMGGGVDVSFPLAVPKANPNSQLRQSKL
jgi:hypothetical protein